MASKNLVLTAIYRIKMCGLLILPIVTAVSDCAMQNLTSYKRISLYNVYQQYVKFLVTYKHSDK